MSNDSSSIPNITTTEAYDAEAFLFVIDWLDIVLFVICTAILFVVVIGNLLILIAMRRIMILHVPTNMLIVNLAVSDISVGFLVMPFTISSLITKRHFNILGRSPLLCTIVGAFRVMALCSSTYTVAVISFERYIGVEKPIAYKSIVTKKFAGVAIVCIWIYSVLYSMITIALPQSSYQYNDYSGYCMEQWYYNSNYGELAQVITGTLLNFILPLSLMGFYYSKVLKALHADLIFCRHMRIPSSFKSRFIKTKRDREINSAWTILIILIAFVCCWLPFLLLTGFVITGYIQTIADRVQLYFVTFANAFYFVGCGINPLIYIFRCERFRTEIKRVINKTFGLDGLLWGDAIKNKSGLFKPDPYKIDVKKMSRQSLHYFAQNTVNDSLKNRFRLRRGVSEVNSSALVSFGVAENTLQYVAAANLRTNKTHFLKQTQC